METLHERWKNIDKRLRRLDWLDHEEEAELIAEAYDDLILAYQESRELNYEMEQLTRDALMI